MTEEKIIRKIAEIIDFNAFSLFLLPLSSVHCRHLFSTFDVL